MAEKMSVLKKWGNPIQEVEAKCWQCQKEWNAACNNNGIEFIDWAMKWCHPMTTALERHILNGEIASEELLEALEEIRNNIVEICDMEPVFPSEINIMSYDAAIAKAKGEL